MCSVQAKKLGKKYILLDLIGTGGMAEVYRSMLLGEKGFEKLIVIKKLLPQIAQDKEMIRLFIGEARLAALLQHENIAATYDFGELDNDFFLAIEYLFGKDLHTVMQRAKECKRPLGPRYALMIASKICEGMDYAHGLKDLQNNPLNIIHRDLTPHNVFITYDGKVKIIDFGIAKAEMIDNRTRADVVKGKVSYMSPEQLSGAVIDSRSDIFSIGIMLYEMISEQRMYRGDTPTLIRKCMTVEYEHLETIIRGLPTKLYAILHKALASDIESRYQSCAEMQADIDNLLFYMSERPDSKILKKYIRNLFKNEYESDQKKTIRAMESVWETDTLPRLDNYRNVPGNDKTIADDTLKNDIPSKPLHKKHFFLIASICLISVMSPFPRDFIKEVVDTVSPPHAHKFVQPPSHPLTPEKAEDTNRTSTVKKLLIQAEKAMADNRLLEPKDNCALKSYEDILRIDPENSIAQDGLRQIADRYVDLADKALAENKIPEAEGLIDDGLAAFPGQQELYTLKDHAEQKKQSFIQRLNNKEEQRLDVNKLATPADDSASLHNQKILATPEKTEDTNRTSTVKKLLMQAEKALADNRLLEPRDNCALKFYQDILRIDPENDIALEALRQIAGLYVELTEKALAKQKYPEAERFVDAGLKVFPEHKILHTLKSQAEFKEQSFIQELLNKAEQCLEINKLTIPSDDSAYLYYHKILTIDPDSAQAQAGFQKIADRYASMADMACRKFDFRVAEKYVKNGLMVVPDHRRLLELKRDLTKSKPEIFFKVVEKNIQSIFSN